MPSILAELLSYKQQTCRAKVPRLLSRLSKLEPPENTPNYGLLGYFGVIFVFQKVTMLLYCVKRF